MRQHPLNLVVALPAEAKPINRMLGLKRMQPDQAYPVYARDNIRLVLSGPGTEQAYQASMQLADQSADGNWLNLGIAAHPHLPVGCPLWISVINDPLSANKWSLQPCSLGGWIQACLNSVNQVDDRYAGDCASDMEAAGMMSALSELGRISSATVLKIVSDNKTQPYNQISGKLIQRLFAVNESRLTQLFDWL